MADELDTVGAKLNALGLWQTIMPYHWALRPRGTVLPYFCAVLKGEGQVAWRFLLLEGWQTFHDFVRTRIDRNFGFYLTPMEMAHFELVVLADGALKVFRHDPGFLPVEVPPPRRPLAAKLLWEAYGVMLRLEGDPKLALSFSAERAMFARVEGEDGRWRDEPLVIPEAPKYVEQVRFPKELLARAKDLPLDTAASVAVDFRLRLGVMTREARPRTAYALVGVDGESGERIFFDQCSAGAESGLKGMWEEVPQRILARLVERGLIPGEIRLRSGRLFRLLRPLGVQLPLKFSLHDSLPALDRAFAQLP